MKNERHVLFSPLIPFGVVLSLEYMHFLNIMTYLLMSLFTSLFWKTKSVDIIYAQKKLYVLY